jgi:diguanylate cyclase (GGDEF)-like protein
MGCDDTRNESSAHPWRAQPAPLCRRLLDQARPGSPAMTALDPRTVILLCGLMGGLMSVVLFSLRRNYPRGIAGLGDWARGMLCWFLSGLSMVLLRGRGPELLSIALPNLLLLCGAYLLLLGSQRFVGRPPAWAEQRAHAAGIAVASAVLAWFATIEPSYRVRITIIALLLLYAFARMLVVLWRHGHARFSIRVAWVMAGGLAALQAQRVYTATMLPAGEGLFDASLQNLVYITALPVLVLMLAIGLVLMANDRLADELAQLAASDPLTGAFNRRSLSEAGERGLARAARAGTAVSVLCMDLDHFKRINDEHGHQAGDRVLQRFVALAQRQLRTGDVLGRFGGEEFVAVLADAPGATALQVAERLREAFATDLGVPPATVSIGVACAEGGEGTFEDLVGRADEALYRAKSAGRNRVSA